MTDYENDFPSVNEVGSAYLQNVNALGSIAQEKWPQTNTRIEINELEALPFSDVPATIAISSCIEV